MLALPGEHRHGCNPRADLRRDVEQIGIDLAAIQNGVEKLPFVRCHDEQEREPFPTERNGFFYPSVDVAAAAFKTLAVAFGRKILDIVPGRVSTEVDARLSYDTEASLEAARDIIRQYNSTTGEQTNEITTAPVVVRIVLQISGQAWKV